jgi:hypothetical protein
MSHDEDTELEGCAYMTLAAIILFSGMLYYFW